LTKREKTVAPRAQNLPFYRSVGFWAGSLVSLAAIVALAFWAWSAFHTNPSGIFSPFGGGATIPTSQTGSSSMLPAVAGQANTTNIGRMVELHTNIPARKSSWLTTYVVKRGDTVYSIAQEYGLFPESILWGNADILQDDPNLISPGTQLNILPTNGILYKWQEGDTIEKVASELKTTTEAIVDWPGNGLNPLDPKIDPGTLVIVPGGSRPFKWEQPVSGLGGRSRTFLMGPGACTSGYDGVPGTDAWGWPTADATFSPGGYDFGPGHGGIDIRAYMGQPIYASQAGVVVYAGSSTVGYGLLVIVDHLNGWHTLYAHLSQWNMSCGQQVYRGTVLGLAGSTGNSSGPHLHFEMRYNGGKENPWGLLP
jgi:murein DD-endopeptidase MepM/ murein hydrolase activator NlpD